MEKGESLFFLLFFYAVRVKTKGRFVLRHGFSLTHPKEFCIMIFLIELYYFVSLMKYSLEIENFFMC